MTNCNSLLENKHGQKCQLHSKNFTPFYFIFIDDSIYLEYALVLDGLSCFVCGKKRKAATILLYNQFQHGWPMACLAPLLFILILRL